MKPIVCLVFAVQLWALTAGQRVVQAPDNIPINEPDFPTPEYILPCSRNDPKLGSCIQRTFNHLKPYLVQGIPELGLEPIEPLVIPRLGMTNGQGNVRVNAIFTDINCRGAGSYNVTKASANIKNYRLDLQLALPKVELRGQYNVTGQVLVLPIQSYGQFWARIEKISAIARIQGVEFLRDNVRYMRISRMLVDFKLGKTAFRIDDALNRNNVIGQAMNQFLNENSNEIIEEMRKPASESIAKHFQGFLNQAFEKLPLKVWLRDT